MNNEQINVAIAEACGLLKRKEGEVVEFQRADYPNAVFQRVKFSDGRVSPCYIENLPNYCSDLNAMAEAVLTLPDTKRGYFNAELFKAACNRNLSSAIKEPDFIFVTINAIAHQRAEAFLRTLGRWQETTTTGGGG